MNALIILAHGSRRHESNQEIVNLVNEVKKISGDAFNFIEYAYLELVEPTPQQSIESVVNRGVSDITIVPYFLNSGNHVKRDIPGMVETAIENYPHCRIRISACVGMFGGMPKLILDQAKLC